MTAEYDPAKRRRRSGWRIAALYAGPAFLLGVTVLPTALLAGRLPRYEVPPYQHHALSYAVEAGFWAVLLIVGWAAVVVARPALGPARRRQVWQLWLPLVYGFGGFTVMLVNPPVLLNVDRQYGLPPDAGSSLRMPLAVAVILGCTAVGLLLGRRASALGDDRSPPTRAVWMRQVDAGLSWWLRQGLAAASLAALFSVPVEIAGYWMGALSVAMGTLGAFAILIIWVSAASITISPAGIRVRYGGVPLLGRDLPMAEIASVEVSHLRGLSGWTARGCLPFAAAPGTTTMLVRTHSGARRHFALPGAEEASEVLGRWLLEAEAVVGGERLELPTSSV